MPFTINAFQLSTLTHPSPPPKHTGMSQYTHAFQLSTLTTDHWLSLGCSPALTSSVQSTISICMGGGGESGGGMTLSGQGGPPLGAPSGGATSGYGLSLKRPKQRSALGGLLGGRDSSSWVSEATCRESIRKLCFVTHAGAPILLSDVKRHCKRESIKWSMAKTMRKELGIFQFKTEVGGKIVREWTTTHPNSAR